MKLLKSHKEAIVGRIMKDVPAPVTLSAVGDLFRQEIAEAQAAVVPPEILKLALDAKTRKFFKFGSHSLPYCLGADRSVLYAKLDALGAWRESADFLCASGVKAENDAPGAAKMLRALVEQEDERDAMRRQLMANLSDVKTSEVLIKRFPEFEKYLPKEEAGSFPVATTNLIASLSKLGWPAGAQAAAA
jgi:hypothetical protein